VDHHVPVPITALGNSVAGVALGGQHTCALATDGSLWCWGENTDGELGDGTTVDQHVPVPITALGNSVAGVALGGQHTCARKTDGSLWCWGSNHLGQLGDGTHAGKLSPVQVTALGTAVADVALGGDYTCARKTDGTLWCWGYGHDGQLGNGTGVGSQSPVQVAALGNAVAEVALDLSHTCARKTDGSLWCWGGNGDWQLGDGTQTPTLSPIAVTALGTSVARVALGEGFSCALEADGSLWCWGFNWNGNLGDGTHADEHWPARVPAVACP
jgi:alpha-tubulin suppressor-like RCC1 family protein